jgi:ParB-like chromosome segregation protein Spo0J
MVTTKRYECMSFDKVRIHPHISNHRPLQADKVAHLERDILTNGLLEPLIVWERSNGEYYVVGGFHCLAAIEAIRAKHVGYFDQITDYFETVRAIQKAENNIACYCTQGPRPVATLGRRTCGAVRVLA